MHLSNATLFNRIAYLIISAFFVTARGFASDFASWSPSPPMGWNSYDVFGDSVTERETLENARVMSDRLAAHGWKYIVIDYRWYDPVGTDDARRVNRERAGAVLCADRYGRLIPAPNRFPSSVGAQGFRLIADRIHSMGLRFGIHIMRGIPRQAYLANSPIEGSEFSARAAGDPANVCNWCPDMYGVKDTPAGQAWYDSIFRLYASWGVDFVKVDDLSAPFRAPEIKMVRKAIDRSGRPIVFSASPGETPLAEASEIASSANMWRISGDFWDEWKLLDAQFDMIARWSQIVKAGHWPDADMLPLGHIGIRCTSSAPERWTRFTKDEQMTMLSLWALASSPLMIGVNLIDCDDWTLGLITNDSVLRLDQDLGGSRGHRVANSGPVELWRKETSDGHQIIGVFNRGPENTVYRLNLHQLGLEDGRAGTDLWSNREVSFHGASITLLVPAHGVRLISFPRTPVARLR